MRFRTRLAAALITLALLAPAGARAGGLLDLGALGHLLTSLFGPPGPPPFALYGTIAWDHPDSAAYVEVDVLDLDTLGSFTASTLDHHAALLSGRNAIYALNVHDGDHLIVSVTIETCADGGIDCARTKRGTVLRYSSNPMNVPRGHLDLDLTDMTHPLHRICGTVSVPDLDIRGGTAKADSTNDVAAGSFEWIQRVPLDGNDDFCVQALEGFVKLSATLDIQGCAVPVGEELTGFENLGLVTENLYDVQLVIPVSSAADGSITGQLTGVAALFPASDEHTGYFISAQRTEAVTDCQGGVQFGSDFHDPYTIHDPGTTDPGLTPGTYDVVASVSSFGALVYEYTFTGADVELAADQTRVVDFALGPPVVFGGDADLGGWGLGASDSFGVTASLATDLGTGSSRATSDDLFPANAVPVKVIADTSATLIGPFTATASATFNHADGSFAFLGWEVDTNMSLPLSPGTAGAPGLAQFGVQLGQFYVDDAAVAGDEWEGATLDDTIHASAFAGAGGFHASLAPGYYQGFLDSDFTEVDVEVGAGDVEHRALSGPVIRDILPAPGSVGDQITVTAKVLDPDGVQSVTIGGTSVTVDADGAVSRTMDAATSVTIVATDANGKQTSHTRSYSLTP